MDSTATLIYCGIAAIVILALNAKWVIFGLNLLFKTLIWKKQNVGLALVRNLGNNFALPRIIRIKDNKEEYDDKIQMYDRAQFTEGTLWGFPFIILDSEDTKTSYGMYAKIKAKIDGREEPGTKYVYCKVDTDEKQNKTYTPISYTSFKLLKAEIDPEGDILTHKLDIGKKDEQGNPILYDTKIPMLQRMKSSVTVSPHLMKTVIAAAALSKAIEEFVNKNKYILYAAGAAALFAAGALFFSYNNQNSIAQLCSVQLPQFKDEILRQCTVVAQNLTR